MGYESRIHIVRKTPVKEEINGKSMYWCEEIARFNLCKVPCVSDKMCRYKATDAFFYADDGNTPVLLDDYGKPLTEIPVGDAIKIFEEAYAHDGYWRYNPCLQLLKAIEQIHNSNTVVLHYGY